MFIEFAAKITGNGQWWCDKRSNMCQKRNFISLWCKHAYFKAPGPIPLDSGRISDQFWYWKCPNMWNQRSCQTFVLMLDQTFFFDIRNRVPWELSHGCHLFLFDIRDRVSWELSHGCHLNCDTASKSQRFCWQILITATSLTEIPGNAATDVSSITVPSPTENPGSLVMDAQKSIYLGWK